MNIGNIRKKQQSQQPLGSTQPLQPYRSGIFQTQMSSTQSPSPLITSPHVGGLSTVKAQQNKIFNYEQKEPEKMQGTISRGFDLQPQFSLHSPYRNQESRKDLQSQIQGKQIDSAVRETEILGSHGNFDYLKNQFNQLRERSSENSRDKAGKNTLNTRKSSTDSQGVVSRQGRFNSSGRSDKKRNGKSQSNSQSRQKLINSNNPHEQRIAGLNYQSNAKNTQSSVMKRPQSAKNLNQVPSVASMQNFQRTMVTSPSQAVLTRDASQNYLPPKPKPLRNQTMAKLPLVMYQSVGNHPAFLQQVPSLTSSSQSKSKRAPSASSERKGGASHQASSKQSQGASTQGPQSIFSSQPSEHINTLSPLRRTNSNYLSSTQPTSNTKSSAGKKKQKQGKSSQSSNQKNIKSPKTNQLYISEVQNLQNLSPNLGRIRPNEIIQEELKEDSLVKQPMQSFEVSDIKPKGNFGGYNLESQDSSLSLRMIQQQQNQRTLLEKNLTAKLYKTIKPQMKLGFGDEDKKKIKQQINPKGKEQTQQQQPKKTNIEQMRQQLTQKLETKNLAKKAKKPLISQQVDILQKEAELQKQKKQQTREQWQKEKEDRQECNEIINQVFKQPMKISNSNSISRKRGDHSKSQQRPFSAKPTSNDQNQHLLIKVPPVQIESQTNNNFAYDAVYEQPLTETSPLKENKYLSSHNKVVLSGDIAAKLSDQNKIAEFIKKQKREISRRKKQEEMNQMYNNQKKENALKTLKDNCDKRYENFKSNYQPSLNQKTKLRKSKHLKSHKNLEQNLDGRKTMQHRSKSKRKIDEEKENRRLSISPGKQQQVNSKERKSGTKSRSDKKRRLKKNPHIVSQAQLQHLQQNVIELILQNKDQKTMRNSLEYIPTKPPQKSQTLVNLHSNKQQENKKSQILISKSKLKNLQEKQQFPNKNLQPQSNHDQSSNQELSFNHNQQILYPRDHPQNLLIISQAQSLKQTLDQDEYKKIFMSQQSQEMTPIIQQKKLNLKQRNEIISLEINTSHDNNKYLQGVRPMDSVQSFKHVIRSVASLGQSRDDLTLLKTQDKHIEKADVLRSQDQIVIQDYNNYNSQNQHQQPSSQLRSRSGSIEDRGHTKKKVKQASQKAQDIFVVSPQKHQNSGSKTRKNLNKRNGSAGFKRSTPQQPQIITQNNDVAKQPNLLKLKKSQTQVSLSKRPNSANVQKINVLEYQQRQIQQVLQSRKVLLELNSKAIIIQKYLRKYRAKILVKHLKNEKTQVERDYELVRQKYWQNDKQNQIEKEDLIHKLSPIKEIWPDSQLQFNNKINILYEESKQDKQNSFTQQSLDGSFPSKLSRSEANLKNLIAIEQEKLKKQQSRPGSSDAQKQPKQQQSKQPEKISQKEKSSTSQISQVEQEKLSLTIQKSENETLSKKLSDQFELGEGKIKPNKKDNQNQEEEEKILKREAEEEWKRDSFLSNVIQESYSKPQQTNSQLHKQFPKSKKKSDDNLYGNNHTYQGNGGNSNILGSEDKDMSWQLDRRSYQDYFDHNSQILREESKRQSLGSLGQSGSKSQFYNRFNQYETYLQNMAKETEMGKMELKKLNERKLLSPASKKKKEYLEKWVVKQEEKLQKKKNMVNENVNDFISKMDQDLQLTKKKIGRDGSGRKSSLRFNISQEWSQADMSIGHLTSSSIHSTPRINNIGGITSMSQNQQNNSLNAFTNMVNNKSDREITKPTKLFDYKIPVKNLEKEIEQLSQPLAKIEEQKKQAQIYDQSKVIEYQPKDKLQSLMDSIKSSGSNQAEPNIFTNNNFDQESQKDKSHSVSSSSQRNTGKEHISTVRDEDDNDLNGEDESLSRQEPPQFQASHMPIYTIQKQENNFMREEEEDEKFAPQPPTQNLQQQKQDSSSPKKQDKIEEKKARPQIQTEEEYSEAFLALKEPEHPISIEEAKKLIQQNDDKEAQTEILTEYILTLLIEQLKGNLFPKRVIIPLRSPSKEQESFFNSYEDGSPSSENDQSKPIVEEVIDESQQAKKEEEEKKAFALEQAISIPKKKKVRGIRTSMRVVDNYIAQIFKKVKDQEDEFIENLSTPLNKDPLEILLHLQNIFPENEIESAVSFQQSVLPVDLYLDLERNKADVQAVEQNSDNEDQEVNKSMMGEWENIHNKVIFDGINEALDNFRPYGLRGPPMPWSQQTRTLTYKNGQQIDIVLRQVRMKVMEWARTFSGALPCSELLQEYGIRGPLDEDKLNLLREERLALVLAAEIEENELLWTDYEYEETQTKLDVADMILEFLTDEIAQELNQISNKRQQLTPHEDSTLSSTIAGSSK